MKKVTLTFIIACAVKAASAQTDGQPTPYIFPQFTEAKVLQKGGASLQASLNYNLLTQEMCFVQDKQIMVMDNASIIDTIYFNKRRFVPVGAMYYEKLTDTPVSLWIQSKGRAIARAKNPTTQQSNVVSSMYGFKQEKLGVQSATYNPQLPDNQSLELQSVYHLQKDGKFYQVDNLKKMIKQFPGKEAQIETFAKENNIKFTDPADVAKLVVFANK